MLLTLKSRLYFCIIFETYFLELLLDSSKFYTNVMCASCTQRVKVYSILTKLLTREIGKHCFTLKMFMYTKYKETTSN